MSIVISSDLLVELLYASTFLFIVLGLVGNSLVFLIYSRRAMHKLSFSLYFRSLALANISVNLLLINVYFMNKHHTNIVDISPQFCKILLFVGFVIQSVCKWTRVAIAADRMIMVVFPMRLNVRLAVKIQLAVVGLIYAFNMVLYAFLVHLGTREPHIAAISTLTVMNKVVI